VRATLSPPPNITVSEWADAHRRLSREASAEVGRWSTSRAPYQRGIMDAFSDPLIERVVWMKASQVGATEILNNIVGYHVDQDPSPILILQPTVELARAWSTDRLAPMLRDSPRLQGKVQEPRTRESGNTILHKQFPGGHLTVVGANSAAGLASRPIRVVLCDEVDRYPASAGTEGDPVSLAFRRTANFWNRKQFLGSTPTIKDFSRIEAAFAESDQRYYHVPCVHCGQLQLLQWANLKWESGKPETAQYACLSCGGLWEESDKPFFLAGGIWVAEQPGRRTAGFHLSALYSPWAQWSDLVRDFLEAKGNPERMQTFTNTVLGETFYVKGEQISEDTLRDRREKYDAEVPRGVGLLTAGIDVQGDRLELLVKGWGRGEESWLVAWEQLFGDPGLDEVWQTLENRLTRAYTLANGKTLRLSAAGIDSGGHHTEQVYRFVAKRQHRLVFALKGLAQAGRPLLGRPSRANKHGVRLFPVGTDTAKDVIFARLKILQPGPGYYHFPETTDIEYFLQLTAEKVMTRFHKGRPIRSYEKIRPRNEALDLEVYALAALARLGAPALRDLGVLAERASAESATPAPAPSGAQTAVVGPAIVPRGASWMGGWR
jgi:phage terminase large subunit GpA-like protein